MILTNHFKIHLNLGCHNGCTCLKRQPAQIRATLTIGNVTQQNQKMSFREQLQYIVLPQAVKITIPPTVGFLVQVVKGTALASVIGFIELTKAGTMITNATFKPFVVYRCVALLYFVLCFPISLYAKTLEKKINASHR